MARPTDEGSFADAMYDQLQSLTREEETYDYPLLKYVGAIGQMYQKINDYARPLRPELDPWTRVLSIDDAPVEVLPWLSQFVGLVLKTTLSEADQRLAIKNAENWKRGTPAAITSAVLPLLTGGKTLIFVERDGTADVVYTFEAGTESFVLTATAVIAQDATQFRGGGAHSLKVTPSASANSGAHGPNTGFNANKALGARFSFLGAAGVTYRMFLWDVTHSSLIGTTINHVASGSWEELEVNGTAGAVAGNYYLQVDNGASASVAPFYLDDVHMVNDGSYSLTVITRTAETPDSAAVLAAILAQKPGGIILNYVVSPGLTYLELRATRATYTAVVSAYATYTALRGF